MSGSIHFISAAGGSALVDLTEDAPAEVEEDQTVLVTMDTPAGEAPEPTERKRKKPKHSKKTSKKEEEVLIAPVEGGGRTEEKEGDLDDLEFWLSKTDAPTPNKKQVQIFSVGSTCTCVLCAVYKWWVNLI